MSVNHNKAPFSEVKLIGCNIVIESNSVLHTGTIALVEGDSMEIQLPQYDEFDLGEDIRAIIYSPEGIINVKTSMIAKDVGTIVLIIPTTLRNLLNKRKYPRVESQLPGSLYAITDESSEKKNNLILPEPITIVNISLGGIGFILNSFEIRKGSLLFLEMNFDTPLLTNYEVMHVSKVTQGLHYGCRFIDISQETSNALRAYILKTQINNRADDKKREFEQAYVIIEGK